MRDGGVCGRTLPCPSPPEATSGTHSVPFADGEPVTGPPVPARPGHGPRCWPRVARRPSLLSAAQRPATSEVRSARLDASPRTPHLRLRCAWRGLDPVPLPAPWLVGRLVLSRLRLEQSAWTRGRSGPHARRQGGRAPPCATGSWLTHRHAWLQVGPLTGVPVRGPFCTLHVSRICVTVWPFFLRPPRGLGHGPCRHAPGSCPGTRPQGLRFECRLKKTKAV